MPAVGIDMNDDDPLVARRDQRGLIEAGAAGLVGGFEWRRLGKKQCAGGRRKVRTLKMTSNPASTAAVSKNGIKRSKNSGQWNRRRSG